MDTLKDIEAKKRSRQFVTLGLAKLMVDTIEDTRIEEGKQTLNNTLAEV